MMAGDLVKRLAFVRIFFPQSFAHVLTSPQ